MGSASGPVAGPVEGPIEGITCIPLAVGVNGVETVNVYAIDDGGALTLVDCGVWRPAADGSDTGLAGLERGLRTAGFELRDVSRIVVTHAHIDHYGLAGRLMELTGAELWMHAMTDLDCEKYRHLDTAILRRRDMYADHGVPEAERVQLADHPRPLDAVPALGGRGVPAAARRRGPAAGWRELGGDPHPRALAGARLPLVAAARGAAVR